MQKLTRPFWETDTVFNETVLFYSENGETPNARLFFKPDKILAVFSSDMRRQYIEGKDWIVKDNTLYMLENSPIPYLTKDILFFDDYRPDESFDTKDNRYVYFQTGDKNFFHSRQLNVIYTHSDTWKPEIGVYEGRLEKTKKILDEGKAFTFCFYGDSITTGCDCSGKYGFAPNMPDWTMLIPAELTRRYGCDIKRINTAVGGKSTDWAVENAEELIASYKPALAVIAFGMNDGTLKRPPEEFGENMKIIMDKVLEKNPDCEFILVAPTVANPESCFDGLQREYYDILKQYARDCDAVVNMTAIHDELIARKRFIDMTGNNINHPSDFLTRVYAQMILKVFE